MGVEYSSKTVVGEYFGSKEDIAQALIDRGFVEGIEADELDVDEFIDSLDLPGLEVTCENSWTGEGFYLGYEEYDWKKYEQLQAEYNFLMKGDGEVHSFVRVH